MEEAKNEGGRSLLIGIAVVSGLVALISLGGGGGGGALVLGIASFAGGVIYFIPSFVAFGRGHGNGTAILMLNLLLGWLLIPWVAALIWALARNTAAEAAASRTMHAQPVTPRHDVDTVPGAAPAAAGMRTCPFCAEEIRKEAIKCKHCGSAVAAV